MSAAAPADRRPAAELARLGLLIAAVVALGFASGYGPTVLILGFLILCIVAHEFGHYLAARTGGVKVTEFFVFFGPRLWSVRRGETEYGVKSIPLGGYCRIVGMSNLEDVDPVDEPRTYRRASLPRRLLIDVAGSAAHFLIALGLLFAMFFWTGDQGWYLTNLAATSPVNAVVEPSPAAAAGFRPGDRIVSVDGYHFSTWDQVAAFIRSHAGQPVHFAVSRAGRTLNLTATPDPATSKVGISVDGTIHSGFVASLGDTGGAFASLAGTTVSGLVHIFSPSGLHSVVHMVANKKAADNPSAERLSSPVGVTRVLHSAAQSGLPSVLWVVAAINVFIGLFNLLPIFPLDGTRVVVSLYEGIRGIRRRGYRADWARLMPVFYAGMALILFLGLTALFLDLRDVAS